MSGQVLSFEGHDGQGLPPQNLEAEEAVLGGLLLDPEAIERILDFLKPEDFYLNSHRLIYSSCLALHSLQYPCDLMQVRNDLTNRGQLAAVGGSGALVRLLDRTVTSLNIDALARIVVEKAASRRMIKAGGEIQSLGWNQLDDLNSRLDAAEQKVFALRNNLGNALGTNGKVESLTDAALRVYQELEQISQAGTTAISTDFYDLDKMLNGGFTPGTLTIIGGRPSMGKSLLGCNLAYEVAKHHRKPTLIFSLEMDTDSITKRFYSNLAGIDLGRLQQGKISLTEWEKVAAAVETMSQIPVFIDDSPKASVLEIKSKIRSTIAAHSCLNLVVIDYLQMLVSSEDDNLAGRVGEVTRQLKNIAKECKVPIILLSQLNRRVEERSDKRPKQSDLRDSGRIEEDADIILFPYRDEYYNPATPDRGLMEIICTKHRNGATGTVKLLFDGAYSRLQNYAER